MRSKMLIVFLLLALLLAGCGGLTAPSQPLDSKPVENAETKVAPETLETTPTTAVPAPTISFVKTEWESDYVLDENGQKLMISDLISEGRIPDVFRVRFYDNGYVYVDYPQFAGLRGTWMGYNYSEEGGLVIDFPEDQTNSYILVSATAEAIELRNVEGQLFHFVPVPYEGN